MHLLTKILVVDGTEDGLFVDDILPALLTNGKSIGHDIVDQTGIALSIAVDSGQSGIRDDILRAAGNADLVEHILCDLIITKALKIVVDSDALPQSLMDWFSNRVVEVCLAAEDQSEAIQRVKTEIHEHLKVGEDAGVQILGLIDG